MILPGKHLKPGRALLGLGVEVLQSLETGHSVSELWERVQEKRANAATAVSFDWFTLCLSFLYAVAAIDYDRGVLVKVEKG